MTIQNQLRARTLLEWHRRYGTRLAQEYFPPRYRRLYIEAVHLYSELNMIDSYAQQQLVEEQLYGGFDWAGDYAPPTDLWSNMINEMGIEMRCPRNLRALAQDLLDSLASQNLLADSACRLIIDVESRQELKAIADEYYADLDTEAHLNIGGKHVMISSSLERTPLTQDRTHLLRPEVLGLRIVQPNELPTGIVDRVRSGQLVVRRVVGEPSGNLPDNTDAPARV